MTQRLALYTDPERHNTQRYRQMDGRTDDIMMPIADHTLLSAKNQYISFESLRDIRRCTNCYFGFILFV